MANLRLVLTIALPSVTALIGFLYFWGRKRGKGKNNKAITKGDNEDHNSLSQNHVGGGDILCEEKHVSLSNLLNTDERPQCRRRERDKDDVLAVNGLKPLGKETKITQDDSSAVSLSPVQNLTVEDQVENSTMPWHLSDITEKEKECTSVQSVWAETLSENGVEDASITTSQSLLKDDMFKSSSCSCSESSPCGVIDSDESNVNDVTSPGSVTVSPSSPAPVDTVYTSEQVLNTSESLAKPSESSQVGVGAKISNHDISMSVSSTDSLSDQVSASEASPLSVSKLDQISASNAICLESSRSDIFVSSTASSGTLDSSASVTEVSGDARSDKSNTDLTSLVPRSSVQGTCAISSEESLKQSPSAAGENTLLMDNGTKTAATLVATDAVECSDSVPDQSGSAAVGGSSESPGCDSNSEASNDSGRGGSVTEPLPLPVMAPDTVRYEFNFPSELCGRLIGKNGRNINLVKEKSGANIALKNNPCTPNFQICVIEGSQSEIDKALVQIRRKFPRGQFPQVDFSPLTQVVQEAPVLMPDIMQLNLPEGVSVDIVVSNIVDAGHIFVQQPTHPTFPSLERLNHFMMACYTQDHMVPPLPIPIEVGVICAAFMVDGWFRAQVVNVSENSDEVDIKYVDYGGYARLQASMLKQIRSDFMTLPFQAVECYMGNITPLQEEEYFSEQGSTVLEELTQGKLLQAQVVNRAEDGIPYIHIYQISGNRVLFINREMVNRKVVRWIEILQ